MRFKDYYRILGITMQASSSEIKSAYRSMSMKWHPDRNPGKDVTSIMQDINEAYAILKDETKRRRYDEEYKMFSRLYHDNLVKTYNERVNNANTQHWEYNYDIQDETLKDDINTARKYAEELVEEFLRSLKNASKNAVKGAWSNAKRYVFAAIFMAIIGVVVRTCFTNQNNNIYYDDTFNSNSNVIEQVNNKGTKLVTPIKKLSPFEPPESWTTYTIDNKAFSISVPSTVELRHEYDRYTQHLQELGLAVNLNKLVFQQKGLSIKKKEAYSHYCRVIVLHSIGKAGDFFHSYETEYIDNEIRSFLEDLVLSEVGFYKLLAEPTYEWICIGNTNAIEIKYRRSGSNDNTTSCTIYLLFNYNEMVKMIISYREQEKDIWQPDLDNIIKTFKWH